MQLIIIIISINLILIDPKTENFETVRTMVFQYCIMRFLMYCTIFSLKKTLIHNNKLFMY